MSKEEISNKIQGHCYNNINKNCELSTCPHFINENKGFDLSKIKVTNLFEMEDDFMEIKDE